MTAPHSWQARWWRWRRRGLWESYRHSGGRKMSGRGRKMSGSVPMPAVPALPPAPVLAQHAAPESQCAGARPLAGPGARLGAPRLPLCAPLLPRFLPPPARAGSQHAATYPCTYLLAVCHKRIRTHATRQHAQHHFPRPSANLQIWAQVCTLMLKSRARAKRTDQG